MAHLIILLAQSIMIALLLLVLLYVIYWILLSVLECHRNITTILSKRKRVGDYNG